MKEIINDDWLDKIDRSVISYIEGEDYEYLYPTLNGILISNEEYDKLKDYSTKWYKEAKNTLFDILNRVRQIKDTDKDYNDGIFTNDLEIIWQFLSHEKNYYKNNNYTYRSDSMNNYKRIHCINSSIIRLDFVKDIYGDFKLIEANADTPCAIPETFYGNLMFSNDDIEWEKQIVTLGKLFLNKLSIQMPNGGNKTFFIVFASSSYPEDRDNANYLYKATETYIYHYKLKNIYCEICNLEELEIFDDGVFLNGRKIDVLYRLHPMELLVEDTTDNGFKIGWKLIELHYEEKVILVNDPSSIFLQNKLLMKHLSCLSFIPRAYTNKSKTDSKVICKNCYGREGEDIKIFNTIKECNEYLKDKDNKNEYLIQDYIEQSTSKFSVVDMKDRIQLKDLYLTYSIFLLDGEPSLVYIRGSMTPICDYKAFWIPSTIEDDDKNNNVNKIDLLKKKLKNIF